MLVPLLPFSANAGCIVSDSDAEVFDRSRSVGEFEVMSSESFLAPGQSIHTRVMLKLVERFKGDVPDRIEMTTPGGNLGKRTDFRSDSLSLKVGGSYVLMLNRDHGGTWSAHPQYVFRIAGERSGMRDFFRKKARGPKPKPVSTSSTETATAQANSGVPGSVVTPSGYFETSGQPTRFTTCDSAEPIPYLIDIDPAQLPTGMTTADVVAAVAEACAAWASSSSLKFRYEGTQSFGASADNIDIQDRRLRIQLHDNYNSINTPGVLGTGGGGFNTASADFTGGKVGTQGFQERLYGFVVLEMTDPFLLNTANFKRVLTHEIGHALGLDHSSENSSEPNAVLKAATMYYSTESDSTGATVQAYDVNRIQFGYPVSNTPPYTIDRIIPVITTAPPLGALPVGKLGVNRIQLRASDQQGTALTVSMISSTSLNGTFSLLGTVLTYTPNSDFGGGRFTSAEIENGDFYDNALIQFSDGVNLSRTANCTVIGFERDTTPADGLPDDWMMAKFSTISVGALGSGRHPDDDPDKDGLTNRVEWYLDTNPHSAVSGPIKPIYDHATRKITYTPTRFAPYWIESSSSLAPGSWSLRRVGSLYQSSGTLSADFSGTAGPTHEFYRIGTGP